VQFQHTPVAWASSKQSLRPAPVAWASSKRSLRPAISTGRGKDTRRGVEYDIFWASKVKSHIEQETEHKHIYISELMLDPIHVYIADFRREVNEGL
jgi:hypothetical protein